MSTGGTAGTAATGGPASLRLGFVTGATPDKWARRWQERHPRGRLDLVPLDESAQEAAVRAGEVDMCVARLPIATDGLHVVRLYEETMVAVAGLDHLIAAADEVELADLADEQLVTDPARVPGWAEQSRVERLAWPAMSEREAVEVAASGAGIAVVPQSVARLLHRKDALWRPIVDVAPAQVALVWLVERDGEAAQEMVGIARGRTSRSSRG